MDVPVLEGREYVGGSAVTEEAWPGYRVSSAAYVVSPMPPRIIEELERFGYRVSILDLDYWSPFPDGSCRCPWYQGVCRPESV